MQIPYWQVDAFASRIFAGNPAGVCVVDEWLPVELMRSIAAENKHSETAFILASTVEPSIRWFTPEVEVDLCGHATLAAAHVLFQEQGWPGNRVSFRSQSGVLPVEREGDWLYLDFPSRPATPCRTPELLIRALSATPVELAESRDYLAVFPDEQSVQALKPDFTLMAQLERFAVIATAPGNECDFVSRFFAPAQGVDEDPVTGSAHCTLIPYWSQRLGKKGMQARQISARGGEIRCEDRDGRVRIGGQAKT